ncbi:MAG: TlpA family protein disulfide reductase [Candidatus Kapaibacterium sp.]
MMKNYLKIIPGIILLGIMVYAAAAKVLPGEDVKDLRGKTVNTKTFDNDGKPIIISFWATWCKPCLVELNAIDEKIDKWEKETGVKFIAVSIDDSRNSRRVAPYVKSRGWDFDVYLDVNGDFRRSMNVNNPPHTFVLNGNKEIVWEHNGYAPGGENEIFEQVKKALGK